MSSTAPVRCAERLGSSPCFLRVSMSSWLSVGLTLVAESASAARRPLGGFSAISPLQNVQIRA